jgi:hypothetical protein
MSADFLEGTRSVIDVDSICKGMRLDVVVDALDKVSKMKEAVVRRTGLEVRFFHAPRDLHYVLPFPFVMVESDSNEITRTYGEEAEKLFYEIVQGPSR